MNFLEAVEAMKEGKKVRRQLWTSMDRCVNRWIEIPQDVAPYYRNDKGNSVTISYQEFEATDWEVVENDKDWNLAKQLWKPGEFHPTNRIYGVNCLMKCRDLILADLDTQKPCAPLSVMQIIKNIINKRFGDLK